MTALQHNNDAWQVSIVALPVTDLRYHIPTRKGLQHTANCQQKEATDAPVQENITKLPMFICC